MSVVVWVDLLTRGVHFGEIMGIACGFTRIDFVVCVIACKEKICFTYHSLLFISK